MAKLVSRVLGVWPGWVIAVCRQVAVLSSQPYTSYGASFRRIASFGARGKANRYDGSVVAYRPLDLF